MKWAKSRCRFNPVIGWFNTLTLLFFHFSKDPDYEDNFIRPELNKRLLDEFKAELNGSDVIRNQYREKILSIVKNGSKVPNFTE